MKEHDIKIREPIEPLRARSGDGVTFTNDQLTPVEVKFEISPFEPCQTVISIPAKKKSQRFQLKDVGEQETFRYEVAPTSRPTVLQPLTADITIIEGDKPTLHRGCANNAWYKANDQFQIER